MLDDRPADVQPDDGSIGVGQYGRVFFTAMPPIWKGILGREADKGHESGFRNEAISTAPDPVVYDYHERTHDGRR